MRPLHGVLIGFALRSFLNPAESKESKEPPANSLSDRIKAMKVDQLKVELAERGSTHSGRKAILQRRLHALLVQAAIERHGADMDF